MKFNLFTTYFEHKNPERLKEIRHVLDRNIQNPTLTDIYIFAESSLPVSDPKVHVRELNRRPTFKELFDWSNEVTGEADLNIICNSDIYFDRIGLSLLQGWMEPKDAIALTRWDILTSGAAKFMDEGCSQDTWIFSGKIKPIDCDFPMGYRGCDNKLAYEIRKAGYTLLNPSILCKTYHYHQSGVRDWSWTNTDIFVEGPYNCVDIIRHTDQELQSMQHSGLKVRQ